MQQKNSCHAEIVSASSRYHNNKTLKQVQGDVTRGFTLIEVLVVILIIGVLAAVALPQYQKAVLKSRYSALMPIGKSLANGNEAYFMENGEYASDPTNLDIAGKENYDDGTDVTLEADPEYLSYVRVANSDKVPNARYVVYQKHSKNFADTTMCEAQDDTGAELCKGLGGVFVSENGTEGGWTAYLLSGQLGVGDSFEVPCPENSKTCDDDGKATQCNNGYYISDGLCEACPENSTCNSTTGAITGCIPGYYSESGACVAQTLWRDNNWCSGDCQNKNFVAGKCQDGPSGWSIGTGGCSNSTFSGTGTRCNGSSRYTCSKTTYTGKQSSCYGNGSWECAGSTFYGGAYCGANSPSSCDQTTYMPNEYGFLGCCSRHSNGACPIGTPKCKQTGMSVDRVVWNEENKAYEQDGWWGDCCNPTAVGGAENCGTTPICS